MTSRRRRRRFGSVRRLPSGRYQARYSLPSGEAVNADRTFATKTEADRYLSDVDLRMAAGTWTDPRRGRITVAEYASMWMGSATHLRPKTKVGYASLIRCMILPTLGQVRLGDLRPVRVREWVAECTRRGLSASRVRQSYRLLSQMLATAQLDGYIATSPCVGVRLPRLPEHEPEVLTAEQVDALAREMQAPYGLFTLALAYTGCRFGEMAAVRHRFVDLEGRWLTVAASLSDANGVMSVEEPKSHQHRVITLPGFLAEALGEHMSAGMRRGPDVLVFTSPDGLPIRHPNFMRRVWNPARDRAGLPDVTPHDLRATHATWLYDMGWSPVEIAARLGHAKATVTTKHYARRVVGRDVEIAAGLDVLHSKVEDEAKP